MISEFKMLYSDGDTAEQSVHNALVMAKQFNIEFVDDTFQIEAQQAVFEYVEDRLILHLLLNGKPAILNFDLADGEVGFRASRVSKSNEIVARAIGCKPHYRPKVLDATAGMGRDSLMMAMLGCNVIMQERNFAIYHLLKNALARFQSETRFSAVSDRLTLLQQDSIDSFDKIEGAEVIYLDPMFPDRKKSALVKKEMRLFKLLAGDDSDADQLLENALLSSAKRVVVKRPKEAPVLSGRNPNHEIVAKKFRYDVYLIHNTD